jgi:serine protease Do
MFSIQKISSLKAVAIKAGVFAACLISVAAVTASAQPATAPTSAATEYAQKLSEAFEAAAARITPSVVNISASTKPKAGKKLRRRDEQFMEQFRQFFGDEFAERFNMPEDGAEGPVQQGLGTGVIVDPKGLILTNNHVLGEADEVDVRLQDGRKFKAQIVGRDERSDLAVVKIKANDLVAAKLGESDNLRIGQWVVAAGNPFGLDNSITAGIISAKGRSIIGGGQYEDFIQTDAAINPGNSGGPLVNLEGEVVGINTAIFSRSGGYMGIGFAIPISMAKGVMESLINSGKVVRGWLGVGIQNLSEGLAQSFNYSGTDGALVGHVEPTGPAAKAGLKQGDIIVALSGDKLKDVNQLRNRVAAIKPGSKVELDYIREGKKETVSVVIGELPSQPGKGKADEDSQEEAESAIGIVVEDITPQVARRLGTTRKSGVVVMQVRPNGIGAQAGLSPGDLVVSVDGKLIKDAEEFRAAVKKADLEKGARVVVETQGMERFVFLKKGA